MQESQSNLGEFQEMSFFWRWIYPILLCIGWGALLGLVIGASQDNAYSSTIENLFSGLLGGAIISVALFIMYETPFNKLIQLLAKIPWVGLIFILPWLLYWIFVWPIGIIDKIIGKIIEKKYSANLTSKSWK